ncbi:MAG: glycosyltransferase [Actinobacteria bacterium]|nr:glycosyltransferase [Actinomycetota bacterium]MCL6104393.1 glycosyltransferase [Actinomycetota bacterium]
MNTGNSELQTPTHLTATLPKVLAVVVACSPGNWFEQTLRAFQSQDYQQLSIVIIDANSSVDITSPVTQLLASADVKRLPYNNGFASNANEILTFKSSKDGLKNYIDDFSFLWFCHDDIAPDPNVLSEMVIEAFRSNAGIVTPKMFSWDVPDKLLSIGVSADKFGGAISRIEPGEIDQGQHDASKEVLMASGGSMLIRRDLFEELGGFDGAISMLSENLDISWRAHIAGARVVVAPRAHVKHLQAALTHQRSTAQPDLIEINEQTAFLLRRRYSLRMVLKNYSGFYLMKILPQLLILWIAEAVFALLTRHSWKAKRLAEAMIWNLAHLRELKTARSGVQSKRISSDSSLTRLQAHGTQRLALLSRRLYHYGLHAGHQGIPVDPAGLPLDPSEVTGKIALLGEGKGENGTGTGNKIGAVENTEGDYASISAPPTALAKYPPRGLVIGVWSVAIVVEIIGNRGIIFSHLPLLGQFIPFPSWTTFLHNFFLGQSSPGISGASPPPLAFLILGVLGIALLGHMGAVQIVVVLGCIPLGVIGVVKCAGAFGSKWANLIAGIVYLAIPLPYNALSTGRWTVLLAYAVMPWILLQLQKSTNLLPTQLPAGDESRKFKDNIWRISLRAGILIALTFTFIPAIIPLTILAAIGICLGSLLITNPNSSNNPFNPLIVAAVSGIIGLLLCLPYSISIFRLQTNIGALGGFGITSSHPLSFGDVLRFNTINITSPLDWTFIIVAGAAVLVGKQWRLGWAASMWIVALLSWLIAWLGSNGWLGQTGLSPGVVLVLAGLAVSLSAALGASTLQYDLSGYSFGWQHLTTGVAAFALLLCILPVLGGSLSGHWNLPSQGYRQVWGWITAPSTANSNNKNSISPGDLNILWIGNRNSIPIGSWSFADNTPSATRVNSPVSGFADMSYAVTALKMPDATYLWPNVDPGLAANAANYTQLSAQGLVSNLGHLLARYDIRYIVVTSSVAPTPSPNANQYTSYLPPSQLIGELASQQDLRQLSSQASSGVAVFFNTYPPATEISTPGHKTAPANGKPDVTSELKSSGFPYYLGLLLLLLGWIVACFLLASVGVDRIIQK